MTADHALWRERVLAYEELDPAERREVDDHLATCAACGALRGALLDRERGARVVGQLTLAPLPLSAEDGRAEQVSVERLVERLVERPPSTSPAPRRPLESPARIPWRGARWAWVVPAAAAAAVLAVVFTPRQARQPVPRLEGLDVVRASGMRGVADSLFRTGDAFVVHMRLTSGGIPVVVAIDEAGVPSLLHPATGDSVRVFAAGPLVLPDPDAGVAWTFSGAPGRETFLSGAVPAGSADFDKLRADLAAVAGEVPGREGRIRAARAVLERMAGAVGEQTVRHHR